jgi:ketosteroid isomerase-like protein
MMRQSLFIGLLFAATASFALAGPKDVGEIEIRAVMNAQVAAWNRGDIDGFMAGYVRSDKLEFVSGGKITRGWQTVRDRYHRKYGSRDKMGTLKFSDIKVRMLEPHLALVLGRWELAREKDRPHGSFTLTFRRQPEGWRIVHDSTDSSS